MSETGDDLARARAAVLDGRAIVYPTETIYGIGVDATSEQAVERLLALKGRDRSKGISLLVSGSQQVDALVAGPLAPEVLGLMNAFWPGPLTIVLPANERVSPALVGPSGGVGLRCSADPMVVRLLEACSVPVTSTSANPSALPPATTAGDARAYFGDRVAYYLEGGARTGGVPSSVIEFLDGQFYLRREGALSRDDLTKHVALSE